MVTSERTRRELEQMCRDQRAEEKCVLTKGLHAEAKELTHDVDASIGIYNSEIEEIKEKIDVESKKRDKLLKDAKLYGVVNSTSYQKSWCALEDDHPSRVEFDQETFRQIKEILTMK